MSAERPRACRGGGAPRRRTSSPRARGSATSSNPFAAKRCRTAGVASGGRRWRVQITVAPGAHKRRQCVDRVHHVGVGDVAEHAAHEHEVGRDRARVRRRRCPRRRTAPRCRRGRAATGLSPRVAGRARRARPRTSARRGWSASTPSRSRPSPAHMLTTRIGPGGAASSASRDALLHDREPPRERAVGVVVRAVPLVPVVVPSDRIMA